MKALLYVLVHLVIVLANERVGEIRRDGRVVGENELLAAADIEDIGLAGAVHDNSGYGAELEAGASQGVVTSGSAAELEAGASQGVVTSGSGAELEAGASQGVVTSGSGAELELVHGTGARAIESIRLNDACYCANNGQCNSNCGGHKCYLFGCTDHPSTCFKQSDCEYFLWPGGLNGAPLLTICDLGKCYPCPTACTSNHHCRYCGVTTECGTGGHCKSGGYILYTGDYCNLESKTRNKAQQTDLCTINDFHDGTTVLGNVRSIWIPDDGHSIDLLSGCNQFANYITTIGPGVCSQLPSSYNLKYLRPVVSNDINCDDGIQMGHICCDKSCGDCIGSSCAADGAANCCEQNILDADVYCDFDVAPCMMHECNAGSMCCDDVYGFIVPGAVCDDGKVTTSNDRCTDDGDCEGIGNTWGHFQGSRFSDDANRLFGSNNNVFKSVLINRGVIIKDPTPELTVAYLVDIDVFYTPFANGNAGVLSDDEQTTLQGWVRNGGIVVVGTRGDTDVNMDAANSYVAPFGFSVTSVVNQDWYTDPCNEDYHYLTDGIGNTYQRYPGKLTLGGDNADDVIKLCNKNNNKLTMAVLNYGRVNGKLVFMSTMMLDTHIQEDNNQKLARRLTLWTWLQTQKEILAIAEDGAETENNTPNDYDIEAFPLGKDAQVRCCNMAGTLCLTDTLDGGCGVGTDSTYEEAFEICGEQSYEDGMRLCSTAELSRELCARTGCQRDSARVWTSDICVEGDWYELTDTSDPDVSNKGCATSDLTISSASPYILISNKEECFDFCFRYEPRTAYVLFGTDETCYCYTNCELSEINAEPSDGKIYAYCARRGGSTTDGCPSESSGISHDRAVNYPDYELGVRCCGMNGNTCTSSLTDYTECGLKTFSIAQKICSSQSKRLCTLDELDSGICCNAGCDQFNKQRVWSSEYALRGAYTTLASGTEDAELRQCSDLSAEYPVNCCSPNNGQCSSDCYIADWAAAKELCEDKGLRLCTLEELDFGDCIGVQDKNGNSCGWNNERAWTSDICPSGGETIAGESTGS